MDNYRRGRGGEESLHRGIAGSDGLGRRECQAEEAAGRAEGPGQGRDGIMPPPTQDSPVILHHPQDKPNQAPLLGIQSLS